MSVCETGWNPRRSTRTHEKFRYPSLGLLLSTSKLAPRTSPIVSLESIVARKVTEVVVRLRRALLALAHGKVICARWEKVIVRVLPSAVYRGLGVDDFSAELEFAPSSREAK